jgi:hypothetical protein
MLRLNRRNLIASTAAIAAFAATGNSADAVLGRQPGSSTITTITLVNGSANSVNAGSVTQIIGCPFKKGDVTRGTWPRFQLADGTDVPCTILNKLATTWSDGSLKFVPVMLSIPESVPGNGSLTVNILRGGTMPPPSKRRLSDFREGIDPRVIVDGLDNLEGTWVMNLGRGIKDRIKVVSYGSGDAGAVWRVRANARQNGAVHGQLVCDFYVASLANPDGSLKGVRILGKVKLPYYDTTAPMNWISFSRFQLWLNREGTIIRDCFGSNFGSVRAYNFTWGGGSTFNANHEYSTLNYADYGYCTRLSTTGQLPSGLKTNTSYFTGAVTSTTIGFGTCSTTPGEYLVSATSSGSGTQTATPYPYLSYFGALFTAGPTGMWDYVQGAGTDVADTPLRFQVNPSYWVSTGLIPSYDISVAPTSNAPTSYWPNCSEPVTRDLGTTGERDDLGIIPSWYVRHFLTQAAVDEQVVRVASLVGGHAFAINLESSAAFTLPCVNNGSDGKGTPYKNMPAPNPTFTWVADGNPDRSSGFTDTTNPMVQLAGFSQQDSTHMPQFNYYPYLFTGEPWHLDMLLEHANNAVYQRWSALGIATINKKYYALGGSNGGGQRLLQVNKHPTRYGITIGCNLDSERGDAWASGLLASAAGICPDHNPECPSHKQYFSDMNSSTWAAATDIIGALPKFAQQWGLWDVDYSGGYYFVDHWQLAYLGSAVALAATATENRDAAAVLNTHVQYFNNVISTFTGWVAGAYVTVVKMGDELGSPLDWSSSNIAFYGPNITWQKGGQFTITPFSNYTPANNDIISFTDATPTPAGFKNFTPYYFVGLFGTNFGLAPAPGGLPLPLTDSFSGSDCFYLVSSSPPSTGSMTSIGAPTSYNTEVTGMLSYAIAVGSSVSSSALSDLQNRNQKAGLNFTSDPKWAMTTTFAQNPHRKHQTALSNWSRRALRK